MKTREEWKADAAKADRFTAYMRGWYAGAGNTGMDDAYLQHVSLGKEYRLGFSDGRAAAKVASSAAAGRYGYTPSVFWTMT